MSEIKGETCLHYVGIEHTTLVLWNQHERYTQSALLDLYTTAEFVDEPINATYPQISNTTPVR